MTATPAQAWIVDDEAVNRALASAFLERLGWQTRAFASAAEVLDASAQGLPPLMIVDIRMPRMSGTELVQQLRRQTAAGNTRFIAYTAHCLDGDCNTLLAEGFDRVLGKPVSFQQMQDAVEHALAHRA
ncbi:MAG: response regulator [Hydrogenophaga sp.]